MRGRILDSLLERMKKDERIFFLTADMGINLVEIIQEAFPSRFLNVGIAEQNLVGISAGLSNLGYRPFAYTISQFMTHRCYEQIRNDIGIHRYPVTLLGTSTGFDNAPLGPTHHIVDDWGTLRTIPGIDIYCPSSVSYADALLDKILATERPAYVRIPKGTFAEPESGADTVYVPGGKKDVLLVCYGSSVQNCLKVQKAHDEVSVVVFNRLRPLDGNVIGPIFSAHQRIFVIEDHFASSGLYNMLCEFCMENDIGRQIRSLAPPETYELRVGTTADYYNRLYGLDEKGIEEAIWGR